MSFGSALFNLVRVARIRLSAPAIELFSWAVIWPSVSCFSLSRTDSTIIESLACDGGWTLLMLFTFDD